MGGRGRTAVLKGDSFPPIPNLEPWDGKDGEVSGGGQGRRWECDSMSLSVHVNAVGRVWNGSRTTSKECCGANQQL